MTMIVINFYEQSIPNQGTFNKSCWSKKSIWELKWQKLDNAGSNWQENGSIPTKSRHYTMTARKLFYHRMMYFMQHQTLYIVLNTIDNISESCKQYRINPIKEDKISPAESKLKHIQVCYILLVIIYFYIIVLNFDKLYTVLQEFCIHWSEVVAHVLHQWNET